MHIYWWGNDDDDDDDEEGGIAVEELVNLLGKCLGWSYVMSSTYTHQLDDDGGDGDDNGGDLFSCVCAFPPCSVLQNDDIEKWLVSSQAYHLPNFKELSVCFWFVMDVPSAPVVPEGLRRHCLWSADPSLIYVDLQSHKINIHHHHWDGYNLTDMELFFLKLNWNHCKRERSFQSTNHRRQEK